MLTLCAVVLSLAPDIAIRQGVATGDVPRARRSPVHVDPVEAMLVRGSFDAESTRSWPPIEADEKGWFGGPALRSGYVLATVELDAARTMILDAQGHSLVYVNGTPRAGDPYGYGFVRLPVALRAGTNELLFKVTRGRLQATLREPAAPVTIDTADATLPDVIAGEPGPLHAAVVVSNGTRQWLRDLSVAAGGVVTDIAPIGPYTVRKVAFRCDARPGEVPIELWSGRDLLAEATVTLRDRRADERHVRTFVSEVDGSVQYYAVTPASQPDAAALVLTLHGAGVEGRRQAAVYAPKTWAHVVAPTNRRRFGFDWEDWGRLDALEVLDLAMARSGTDPGRVYLTGHSMGGHGVWHLGATFPDRFAAIGPSAGWESFFSYAGGVEFDRDDPIGAILARAQQPSRTRDLARNYLHHGVYILHGDADDNVPVEQARTMRGVLDEFHDDVGYHEQPGAGHWWGDQCCDWGPMFEFFAARERGPSGGGGRFEFVTANPGISASSGEVTIESQVVPLALSSVVIEDGAITATNVASLRIGPDRLVPDGDRWIVTDDALPPEHKGPHRYGPFKDAFRHRPVLVYGTAGTPAETELAYRKARYDAETFWYRGNGVLEIVADREFDPDAEVDRNVILYGNADTNGAWADLLADAPVRVGNGAVEIAGRRETGDDLACLFIRPRPGSDVACVAAVAGTGPKGARLAERLPYFVSGVHYPDCIVIGPAMLADDDTGGLAGVRAAGIFGPDWSVEQGDFAWRD